MTIEKEYTRISNIVSETCKYNKCQNCECYIKIDFQGKLILLKDLLKKLHKLNIIEEILKD